MVAVGRGLTSSRVGVLVVRAESARQFDEAYGLAFAQQLKNKDIPEGGSKVGTPFRPPS